MFKQSLFYLVASIIIVLLNHYVQTGLGYFHAFYLYLNHLIAPIFNQVGLGRLVHQVLLLIFIPVIIVGLPALIYKLIKGRAMPHFMPLTWCVWLILVLTLLIY